MKNSITKHSCQKARLNRNDQIDFLRDFDLLTTVSPQQTDLYQKADFKKGLGMMQPTYVLTNDNQKYKLSCDIDQFKRYGPGIYLLFKFLKYLTIIFGMVSILAAINIGTLVYSKNQRIISISNEFKIGILQTTIYNLTKQNFNFYAAISFSITVLLGISLIYWNEKQKSYVIQCVKIHPLASYSTVILRQLPNNYNEQELFTFLSTRFGQIAEIYTVRNFGDDILYYKEMTEIVSSFKQEKALTQIEPERNCHYLSNKFFQFRNGHLKLKQKIRDSENYKPCFAFIQFKKVQNREQLLNFTNKMSLFGWLKQKQNDKIYDANGLQMDSYCTYNLETMNFVQCQMQPCGILWQNLHLDKKSKILKKGTMILLMIIVLSVSILIIFLFSAVQMSVMNSKFKNLNKQEIIQLKDGFALLSFCINLSLSQFYQHSDFCYQFQTQYIKLTIMIFMIPLSISLFKLVLTQIMKALVSFRRYAYAIKKIQSQSTILFVFYFLVTGLLQLVIYLGSQSTSFFSIFTPLIQSIVNSEFTSSKIVLFSDYQPNWYITASYNVVIIGAISFNLSGIGIIFYCYFRKKIFEHFAKKQKIQIKMNNWLKGYCLQIEYVYAALLTIIYFTLLFGGSMPLLYILAFFSFLILYWSYKYVFINFCAKPLTYNHSINRRAIKMIFGSLVLHSLFTPIFLRASGIGYLQEQIGIFGRIINLWYYLLFIILLIMYYFLEKPIKNFIPIFKLYWENRRNQKRKKTIQQQAPLPNKHIHHNKRRNFSLPTIVRKMHNQLNHQSYSMHQNQQYKPILRTLYTINNKERARKTCVLNKDLLHLYQDCIKTNEQDESDYRALIQVIKLVRRDFKKYLCKHGKGRNPYEKTKRKLYQIYEHSKKGHNHKYTIRLGLNSRNQDKENFHERQKELQDQFQKMSNGTKTKDNFLGSNFTNLEQVIEADSNLQDQTLTEDKRRNQKNRRKLVIKSQNPQNNVEQVILQQTEGRFQTSDF